MASRTLKVEIIGDASSLSRALGNATNSSTRFGSSLKSLGKVAAIGMGAAFAGLAVVVKRGFDEIGEGQKVAAQTGAVLKSTGGIANVTAKHVDALAQSQSRLTGIDDELIQASENLLLTFKNVRNEVGKGNAIFDRATKAGLDLATAGFGTPTTAAKMMGKALNDPVKGMTALGRAGVTFSEDQKKAIAAMVESNNVLGAQKLILKEVESQVGGSAKAFGETMPGQLSKLRNSFEEVAAQIATVLLPYLTRLVAWVNDHMPEIQRVIETVLNAVIGTIQFLAPIIATLIGWFQRLYEAAQKYWPPIQAVIQRVIDWFRTNIVPTVAAVVGALIALWRRFGDEIMAVVGPAFKIVFTIISSTMLAIKAIIETVMALIRGDWGKAWDSLKSIVSNTLGAFRTIVTTALGNLVPAVLGLAVSIGKAIVGGLLQGLANLASALAGKLAAIGPALAAVAAQAAGWAASIGYAIVSGILSGIGGLYGMLKSRLEGTLRSVLSSISPFSSVEEGGAKYIGRPLAEGAIRGWLENSRGLSSAMVSGLRDAVSAAGSVAAGAGALSLGGEDLGITLPPPDVVPTTDALGVVSESVDQATSHVVAFQDTITALPAIATQAFTALTAMILKAVAPLPKALEEPRLAIQAVANALHAIGRAAFATRAALQDTVEDIVRLLGRIGGLQGLSLAHLEGRQHGGLVRKNRPYIVGEAGPELFIPQQSGTIVANSGGGLTPAGGGFTLVQNFHGTTVGTSREFQDTVRRALYDVSRRNPGALPGIA